MKFTQYALVDEQGDDACRTHQDDSETPLVSSSLEGLVEDIATWEDVATSYITERLDPKTGVVKLGGGDFRIVRREIEELPITSGDSQVLADFAKEMASELD